VSGPFADAADGVLTARVPCVLWYQCRASVRTGPDDRTNKEWTIQDSFYHTSPERQPCARQAGSTEVGSGRNAVALTGLFRVRVSRRVPGQTRPALHTSRCWKEGQAETSDRTTVW
jgi:hypothetical protein